MTRGRRLLGAAAGLALLLGLPRGAAVRAQMGGMGQPGGGMGAPPTGQEPKEEGPAEEAPEEAARPTDLEPLAGYPEQNKRKLQIFEVDGYLRAARGLHAQLLPRPGLLGAADDAPRRKPGALRAAALPGSARVRAADGRDVGWRLGHHQQGRERGRALRPQEHRRRQPAPAPRAHAQHHRHGAGARAVRRPRQHAPRFDARLARGHPGLQPPRGHHGQRHGVADVAQRRGAHGFPVHDAGPAADWPERLRVEHRRQARLGRDRQRVRLGALRAHALALGPRHRLQRRRLSRLRRRHDRRPGDGAHAALRAPDRGRVGSRAAGLHVAAAQPGPDVAVRISVRPVAERRRPPAHGLDRAAGQPRPAARAHRPRRARAELRPAGRLPQPGQHRDVPWTRRRTRRCRRRARSPSRPSSSTRPRRSARSR